MQISRQDSLEQLSSWLDSRKNNCVIWIRLAEMKRRLWRFIWVANDSLEKAIVWHHLVSILESLISPADIGVRPVVAGKDQTTLFFWPEKRESDTVGQCDEKVASEENHCPQPHQASILDMEKKPNKASETVAKIICRILYTTQKRHTGRDLEIAMDRSKETYCWNITTIQASASWLVRSAICDNIRDAYGTGYGLICWDVCPWSEE